MFDRAVIVDTVNIAALGAGSVRNDGRLGGRRSRWEAEDVPGRDGEVIIASEPTIQARNMELRFVLEASTRANLLALRDEMFWRFHPRAMHTFRFVDDETRQTTGYAERIRFQGIDPDLRQNACEMILDVRCPDPREYAVADTVVSAIGSTPVALPLGSDRSHAVVVVTGAGTFTLTYRDSGGATIYTLTITGATAPVTINMATGSITDAGGEAAEFLDAGSDFPFAFDSRLHGDFPAAAWPTIACSAGSAEATYQKAY